MAKIEPELEKLLKDAGLGDPIVEYIAARDVPNRSIFASMATSAEELDSVLTLVCGFQAAKRRVNQALAMPITRAKLRFVWRKCSEMEAASSPTTTTAAAAATSTSTSKTAKELPPGKIGGECRKFPQEILLGAEAILARVVNEMKSLSHTSLALHELGAAPFL